ncbi:TPM domain-containing protein [Psychroflexus montanilacus]|uniref:TPM domain-containing protein n=1 Tax=Psychroflexus montanilacus TaxID=2873598 RepID=UPI001CC9BE32|nr:TPM domain-containing protein [Psychroflexus montanilacus]MBZ9651376.1 TPM domain-containing protein [Psychroflexus montanilacus]
MKVSEFINPEEEKEIVEAIKKAELNTSGEIRVHIEHTCDGDRFEHALEIFEKLEMHKTELSNGVLIYVSIDDHQLVILGDKGINNVVPNGFWESTKDEIISQFKSGNYKQGLINGILEAGEQLKQHFPYQSDDTNELNDEISKG